MASSRESGNDRPFRLLKYAPWFGYFLSAILGLSAFWMDDKFLYPLIVSLIIASGSLVLDLKVEVGEMKSDVIDDVSEIRKEISEIAPKIVIEGKIRTWAMKDDMFDRRYREITKELRELSEGTYTIQGLAQVYRDDMRQIDRLTEGETLRSSCPIATKSVDEALQQIQDANYIKSMKAHARASTRGVHVKRLYIFGNKRMLTPELLRHLSEIPKSDNEIKVIFRSSDDQFVNIDFLVFGDHTVSRGHLDIDTGICDGTRVTRDPEDVRADIARFDAIWEMAHVLEELRPSGRTAPPTPQPPDRKRSRRRPPQAGS